VAPLFLHWGWGHWGCNLLLLGMCAATLEALAGAPVVLYVFFWSGIASILISLHMHPQVTSVGCSGAVFGLWAARCMHAWWPPREESRWKITALFAFALALSNAPRAGGLPVDEWAHLGGAAAGMLSYAAWRGGRGLRVLALTGLLALAAWVARPPHAPDFSGLTLLLNHRPHDHAAGGGLLLRGRAAEDQSESGSAAAVAAAR
jgi:membrane associated rhomboid family serine protease